MKTIPKLIFASTALVATTLIAANSQATPPPQTSTAISNTLVGAGDIASCSSSGDEATAKLINNIPGTVFTAGDNAYSNGSTRDYGCYNSSWGAFKSRTKAAAGNHEYKTSQATPFFTYFNYSGKGWYSYEVGTWHVIVLNSNCNNIGGCTSTSAQGKWLATDLSNSSAQCTVAFFHHPRWSSGSHHGSQVIVDPLWKQLAAANVDLVINGHEHNYERFNNINGMREIVVGTGGASYYPFGNPLSTSQVRNSGTWGVLKLDLNEGNYSWNFIPVQGKTFTDSGNDTCH